MERLTEPLREEHRQLRPQIDEILAVADALDERASGVQHERLAGVSTFLREDLLRHAAAEEAAVYPVVGWALGAPNATATMARDHLEIARMSARLDRLVADERAGKPDVPELRGALYGLHAVLALHFAKEEEVYLPILDDRLTADSAARLFAEMEAAAARAA